MTTSAGAHVFLSYRRDDAMTHALLLARTLEQRAGARVFVDVDQIPPGVDFVDYVAEHIESSDAMIVLIGDQWLTITDDSGERRLDDQADQVRIEVTTALERGIPIFPVLVKDARMPRAAELPGDLSPLARRNAVALRESDWDRGADRLAEVLPGAAPSPVAAPVSVAVEFPSRFTDRWFADHVDQLSDDEIGALLNELHRRNWQDWEIDKRVLVHRQGERGDAAAQNSPRLEAVSDSNAATPPRVDVATDDAVAQATVLAARELVALEQQQGRPPRERDLAAALGRHLQSSVVERRWPVPDWDPPPGNIDVWTTDWQGRPSTAIETKLKDGNLIYESLWDLIKLLSLATLEHVEATYLVVGTTVRNWDKPVAFAEFFNEGRYDLMSAIERHPDWWRWCLEGGRARPLRMPTMVDVGLVARIEVTLASTRWELRAAAVTAAGEWVGCEDGWPPPGRSQGRPARS